MAGRFKFEPRTTHLTRDDVNQLNKQYDLIELAIGIASKSVPAAPSAANPNPTSVNIETGLVGPSAAAPAGAAALTDGVTIGGDGETTAIFLIIKTGEMIVIPLAFAASPYSAVLNAYQMTLYLASSDAGADFVFNLPAATGSGQIAVVKKMDANAHNIAITPNGTDTIDGVNAAVNIALQYDALRLVDSAAGAWSIW